MYIYDTSNGKDKIICMRRDEFLHIVSEGVKILQERCKGSGLPYLSDDKGVGYFNFSIEDEEQYYDILNKGSK